MLTFLFLGSMKWNEMKWNEETVVIIKPVCSNSKRKKLNRKTTTKPIERIQLDARHTHAWKVEEKTNKIDDS
jgi:hypothetical protein